MRLFARVAATCLMGVCLLPSHSMARAAVAPNVLILDLHTDKARYRPGERVTLQFRLANGTPRTFLSAQAVLSCEQLDNVVGRVTRRLNIAGGSQTPLQIVWQPPAKDFQGYLVDLTLESAHGKKLANAVTAVDVSSSWARFPRYGYVAHYGKDTDARAWVDELNRFHIDGLQFYDVVYKHHVPLAGTIAHPRDEWADVAKRPTYRNTVLAFIRSAHARNMTAMVYDAAYAAYANALDDGSGVKIQWAAWPNATCPRAAGAIKRLRLPPGWATPSLLYMNTDSPGWRTYLFARMQDLFAAYPFDGWHIDTYGVKGAYAYDGSYINYIASFPSFVRAARNFLHKQVVLNTVFGWGEDEMANSASEFVYSELWPKVDATYASILRAADGVHAANPRAGLVFAAYAPKPSAWERKLHRNRYFNSRAVLLTDAVMFAAGASHIELGDGERMLSAPYFPADQYPKVSPHLRSALTNYYNFLVAYENYLRDGVKPASCSLTLEGTPQTLRGDPGAVWTFSRRKRSFEIVHLINLTGLRTSNWFDPKMKSRGVPELAQLQARIHHGEGVKWVGWASPDVDSGRFHKLDAVKGRDAQGAYEEVVIPILKCWDVLFIKGQ
ncbi:MAG: glycoside hydrolase family 66 protein [Terriglobia bacterium]